MPSFFRSHLFTVCDTNGDGKMTFEEWHLNDAVRHNMRHLTEAQLLDRWNMYDTMDVGYLTEDEAVNRTA